MFHKTPSGDWPMDMVEDLFLNESIKEHNREMEAARAAQ